MENVGTDALKYVWKGAIPLQIHLHDSEVTTLPPPPPVLMLASRIGYLPLLAPQMKPLFNSTLPPGDDTVWFEYKGLALKWYIPTGVLFDLLCAEPERPWNLTVHFRGYPSNTLTPCEGEDAVKWNFINSLKEAAYIINGNCKHIMNMSQSDQLELWRSVLNGNLESFLKVTSKLKLGAIDDDYTTKLYPSLKACSDAGNTDNPGLAKTGRIPVRLYARIFTEVFDDLEDAPEVDSWEKISYINRPIGLDKDEGKCFTLSDAMKTLLPEYFGEGIINNEKTIEMEVKEVDSEDASDTNLTEEVSTSVGEHTKSKQSSVGAEIKLIRIQGIEPKSEIPFSWVVNNLMNPDHYLHICVYLIHVQPSSL
ncbi:autophagy protein 5 isoform X1 [Beta vulgaris subsp. vulgaris]|uniref:autophagy protein 5 isoform X1 n=1 Tax=Beta vulgaris subsp. vulgaris TaxID=3555 RepID=UPI00203755EB|nr:autophagy protein 5 isoform X1 [Beta vulgaris subsp. vulgaris]